jgi:hypothetical protein
MTFAPAATTGRGGRFLASLLRSSWIEAAPHLHRDGFSGIHPAPSPKAAALLAPSPSTFAPALDTRPIFMENSAKSWPAT